MSQQSTGAGMSREVKISYTGKWFLIFPVKFGEQEQLLAGLEESEIVSGFGIDTPPVIPATANELVGALGVRAVNDNTLVLEYLNNYFGVSLPGLESRWKQVCVIKD
jgi:hypothetical protein